MKYVGCLAAASLLAFACPATAEIACYIEMEGRQVDLSGVCEGTQDPAFVAFPEMQSSLMVHGMQNALAWQNSQWQASQQVTLSLTHVGKAAANDVTLTLRGEQFDANGAVETVEYQQVSIGQVPARSTGDIVVEFSFVPDNCVLETIVWN